MKRATQGMKLLVMVMMMMTMFLIQDSCGIQCLNEGGSSVDWWIMLKIPVIPGASSTLVQKGVAYVYLDSTASSKWQYPQATINGTANALGHTLQQIYNAPSTTTGYLLYNDEDPNGITHSTFGHTKGTWGFTSTGGFWLSHSVPNYPPWPTYSYPITETDYGQSLLCLSLSLSTLNEAAQNLLLNKPYIYASNLPSSLSAPLPNVISVLDSKWITGAPYTRTAPMTTEAGSTWQTFAKNAAWNNELWDALVAPSLPSNLLVETWMNGNGGKINTTCSTPYDVYDVNTVSLAVAGQSWSETKDHSKWGVSFGSSPKWTCIGDINRVASQYSRGGGALCLNNAVLASTFQSVVQAYWSCP